MSQSISQVLLHIIFSTKNREPFIQPEVKDELYAYIVSISSDLGCYIHEIGGAKDHFHIACNLSRTISISKFLEEIKKPSSKWIKTKGIPYQNFSWQNGYGIFSLGMSQLSSVKKYIVEQEKHHQFKSFKEEYLEFLKKYKVKYNERYLWD